METVMFLHIGEGVQLLFLELRARPGGKELGTAGLESFILHAVHQVHQQRAICLYWLDNNKPKKFNFSLC